MPTHDLQRVGARLAAQLQLHDEGSVVVKQIGVGDRNEAGGVDRGDAVPPDAADQFVQRDNANIPVRGPAFADGARRLPQGADLGGRSGRPQDRVAGGGPHGVRRQKARLRRWRGVDAGGRLRRGASAGNGEQGAEHEERDADRT